MTREQWTVAGAVALLVVAAGLLWMQTSTSASDASVAGGERTARAAAVAAVPRIDLTRTDAAAGPAQPLGNRDLFGFATPPPTPEPPPPPPTQPTPVPPPTTPTPTPMPPLNIKYVGTLESQPGLKVAMFLTERKEVLTGQVGDTIANRFRIMKIGLESVDIQEVGSGQPRRLPLKGN